MIINQSEIEEMLSKSATPAQPPRPGAAPARGAGSSRSLAGGPPAQIARLLRIRVPVIARLARRRMHVSAIRKFSVGTILEFEKSVEEPLELLINNRCIGRGETVKVSEQFGVRIFEIVDRPSLIRSMGRGA
jgi:flagellar motor switch protein FliN/FliY